MERLRNVPVGRIRGNRFAGPSTAWSAEEIFDPEGIAPRLEQHLM
jgi:hypothetical protein